MPCFHILSKSWTKPNFAVNLSLRPVAGWEGENIHDPGSEGPERNKGQRLRINYRRRLAAGEQEKLLSLNLTMLFLAVSTHLIKQ